MEQKKQASLEVSGEVTREHLAAGDKRSEMGDLNAAGEVKIEVETRYWNSAHNRARSTTDPGDDQNSASNSDHDGTTADCHQNGSNGGSWPKYSRQCPLAGLSVYIIHVKDNLSDGSFASDRILQELQSQEEAARLGCEFYVPSAGEGIWI